MPASSRASSVSENSKRGTSCSRITATASGIRTSRSAASRADEEITMHPTRRDFIRIAGAGAAGVALGSRVSAQARVRGANDRVRVGIVGFSDRSKDALIPAFMKHAGELNFELVAVSDIWSRRREEGAAFIEKLTGKRPALCRNNDELYDRNDVDAVIIATADFQPALPGVEAVRPERDAYVTNAIDIM